ncbi:unnamed protein product [Moneuplotes crassus]|uniref:Uncharacterized protein n=1 Tax=Euplotes crassus TaxID=5936 RepID=A0AAD1TZC1_EUPCR|nr:unnamed protein product [Moneuplotes crassus]
MSSKEYTKKLLEPIDIDDTSCLVLRLNAHGEIIKKIRKLPNIESLTFTHVWWFQEWTRLCKVLKNSCPDSLNQFEFDFSNAGACHYKYQNYHQSLIEIAKKVKNYFSLSYCKLNKEEFEEIIVAARNCSSIRFFACTIIAGTECDFGDKLTDAKFTELSFDSTGHSNYSSWKTNPCYFRNIFTGLAKCSPVLKTNLQFVNILNCEFDKDLARSILSELEFQNAHV